MVAVAISGWSGLDTATMPGVSSGVMSRRKTALRSSFISRFSIESSGPGIRETARTSLRKKAG